jgi:hypothetical protein
MRNQNGNFVSSMVPKSGTFFLLWISHLYAFYQIWRRNEKKTPSAQENSRFVPYSPSVAIRSATSTHHEKRFLTYKVYAVVMSVCAPVGLPQPMVHRSVLQIDLQLADFLGHSSIAVRWQIWRQFWSISYFASWLSPTVSQPHIHLSDPQPPVAVWPVTML